MEIAANNDRYLSYMPEHIQKLANADLPELEHHQDEWKRFLWQRGLELDYQFTQDRTEKQSVDAMAAILDMFTEDEYSPAFISAFKKSLYDVLAYYDEYRSTAPIRQPSQKADIFLPLSPISPMVEPRQNTPSFFSRIYTASLNAAHKTDQLYTKGRNALFGLTITATYSLCAGVAVDIAINGADRSYTKQAFDSLVSPLQNTPKP